MKLPEQNLGKVLSNVLSITYNKVGKIFPDEGNDPFKNEMNTGYTWLLMSLLVHII